MLCKRIISCMDIKDGRIVKGTRFEQLRDAGDPVALAELYAAQGIDELVFLDITATIEKRKALADLVRAIAQKINIPFTVGGGISSTEDVNILLKNGADKISINSAAVRNPKLISDLANEFGSQCVVVAIDAKQDDNGKWWVHLNGGRIRTEFQLLDWAKKAVSLGAGEILFTSMNHDGMKEGFALPMTSILSKELPVPVIASGGAGKMKHFADIFSIANADAALAASIFHFKEIEIPELKKFLKAEGIAIR